MELPAFAGRVVAAPDATFGLPEVSLGLIPGAGGTVSLPRRIGRHRTAWLALTGQPIDAPTALDVGPGGRRRGLTYPADAAPVGSAVGGPNTSPSKRSIVANSATGLRVSLVGRRTGWPEAHHRRDRP